MVLKRLLTQEMLKKVVLEVIRKPTGNTGRFGESKEGNPELKPEMVLELYNCELASWFGSGSPYNSSTSNSFDLLSSDYKWVIGDRKSDEIVSLDTESLSYKTDEAFPDLGPFPGYDKELAVIKATKAGICSYHVTKDKFTPQKSYFCKSCFAEGENISICSACIKACHLGHDIEDRFFQNMYCDCPLKLDCSAGKLEKNK
jgi:hypothetical protein